MTTFMMTLHKCARERYPIWQCEMVYAFSLILHNIIHNRVYYVETLKLSLKYEQIEVTVNWKWVDVFESWNISQSPSSCRLLTSGTQDTVKYVRNQQSSHTSDPAVQIEWLWIEVDLSKSFQVNQIYENFRPVLQWNSTKHKI